MTPAWQPMLDNPPTFETRLLHGLRRSLPALIDSVVKRPERAARPVSGRLEMPDEAVAAFTVAGHDARRVTHGKRAALALAIDGEVTINENRMAFAGDLVVDLATSAILALRLSKTTPV